MQSCGVVQKTVVKVQECAWKMNFSLPIFDSMTDEVLDKLMFPKQDKLVSLKRMPDFNYIHKELLRNGVTKKLL